MVRPGGRLVYCVCSLAREEGEDIVEAFLADTPGYAREAVCAQELAGETALLTPAGDVRTLPSHWAERGGMDGFFASRLRRNV
jgi:16S rRNA (cytosine967-C5)-methyltransferase